MSAARLCSSVSKGNHLIVKRALRDGADPDTCMPWVFRDRDDDKYHRVPVLIVAIYKGYTDVVSILLEAKANVNYKGDTKLPPLTMAISVKSVNIIEQLLKYGADANARDSTMHDALPIHWASMFGFVNVAQMLLDKGGRLDDDTCRWTSLHMAARGGHKDMAEWLLQQGVDITAIDDLGCTAAQAAVATGHRELGEWLKSRELDTATQSNSRLCSAVLEGDHLGVKKALCDGADPDTCMPWEFSDKLGGKHKSKRSPVLTVAVVKGYFDVVNILLFANSNPECKGDLQVAPLTKAVSEGHTNIVKILLDYGADVSAKDSTKHGASPIHWAARASQLNIVQMLYSYGSPLNTIDNYGRTPLHIAAGCGLKNITEWLVQQGVDISAANNAGTTAANYAENLGQYEMAEWLHSCELNLPSAIARLRIQENSIAAQNQQLKTVYIMNYIRFPDSVMIQYGAKSVTMKLERREGATKDSENLRSTFEKLGYAVKLHENMSKDGTNRLLDGIQQNQSLDFLLLFVLSHGVDRDTFFTSDGAQYSLEEIQYRFTNTKCPQLQGKDKIIFSNFCRGQNIEKIASDSVPVRDETPHNMITIHASHEGFSAIRSTKRGTLFVHNLCNVLREQPNLPIQDVFNRIYEKMVKDKAQTPEMKVSAPFSNFSF